MSQSYAAAPMTDDEWDAFAGASSWQSDEASISDEVPDELRPIRRAITNDVAVIAGSEAVEIYVIREDEDDNPQSWVLPVAFPNQASCKLFVDAIQGLEHMKSLGFERVL